MIRDILRLDLAVNSISKALNRVEKIPICVAVNSANPRVSRSRDFWCEFL